MHIYLSNFCHLISAAYCCILSYKDKRIFIADGQCSMFIFFCVLTVDFVFGLLDYIHYKEAFVLLRFVLSRFCSIHITL